MSYEVRTVGQLKAALAGLPDDMPVVQSGDSEGNSVRLWTEVSRQFIIIFDEDYEVEVTDGQDGHGVSAAVLWPVN